MSALTVAGVERIGRHGSASASRAHAAGVLAMACVLARAGHTRRCWSTARPTLYVHRRHLGALRRHLGLDPQATQVSAGDTAFCLAGHTDDTDHAAGTTPGGGWLSMLALPGGLSAAGAEVYSTLRKDGLSPADAEVAAWATSPPAPGPRRFPLPFLLRPDGDLLDPAVVRRALADAGPRRVAWAASPTTVSGATAWW